MTGDPDPRDRQAAIDVAVRYATAIDRRDWTLFRTCFTADCTADYGQVGTWQDLDSFALFMQEIHARCGSSLHRITNHAVETDGYDLRSRGSVDALVLAPGHATGTRAIGWYDDLLTRTEAGWRIRERRFEMVHLSLDLGANAAAPASG